VDHHGGEVAGYFRSIARRASVRQVVDLYRGLGLAGHRRVLDLGAGAGQGSFAAACLNDEVVAIDVNPSIVEIVEDARRRLGITNLTVACRSFTSPALVPGSFDAAICSEVLYVVDTAACMARLAELLRPGGLLYVRTHCFPWALRYWLRSIVTLNPLDFIAYSRRLAIGLPRQLCGVRLSSRYQYLTRRELYRLFAANGLALVAATGERGARDLFALAPVLREWRQPRAGVLYFIDALARKSRGAA
jgi:SAM-dependent methyltransferase